MNFNSLHSVKLHYCRQPQDIDLVSLIARICHDGALSLIVKCIGFIFARDLGSASIIRVSEVFVRKELTISTGPIGKFYKM